MKKIMFNSVKYNLEHAVLKGWKTQTRRLMPPKVRNQVDWAYFMEGNYICYMDGEENLFDIRTCGQYQVGDVVAIAQSYKTVYDNYFHEKRYPLASDISRHYLGYAGWNNKMFVSAEHMPHHIKITKVRVECLQDISDEDCLAEGITKHDMLTSNMEEVTKYSFDGSFENDIAKFYNTPKEAYSALIDKISGKGTWKNNPVVFAYDFELVD